MQEHQLSDIRADQSHGVSTGTDQAHVIQDAVKPVGSTAGDPPPMDNLSAVDDVEQQPRTKLRMLAVLSALFATLFIAALDATIVATAIPTISAELHSASGYTWIGGAYLLANAASSPVWAKLSDIWGRKPILLAAVALFATGSIVCALANSMKMLIAGRSLQGVAAGGLIEMVHITISDLFSMRQRSLYIGLLECVWAVSGGAGPTLGGVLTQLVSWRWIFWINLPVSGSTFLLLLLFLDVHNPRTKMIDGLKAIDWLGSFSILGLTLMVLLGLNFGGVTFPWNSPKVVCLIIFGALMSIFFIYSEKRLARYPIMPPRLFNSRSNIACLLVCFLHSFCFIGGEFYLPLYLQSVQEASPLRSGILLIPLTIATAAMGLTTGIIIHKTGRYLELIWVGTLLMTFGNGLYIHFSASSRVAEIVPLEIVAGFGAGLLFEPPLIALQSNIAQDDIATATATLGFIRNLGLSLSIIIGGVVFQNSMTLQAPKLVAAGLSPNVTQAFGSDAAANVLLIKTITDPTHNYAIREAFAWSMRNMWILYTCVGFMTAIAGLFISRHVLSTEHVETKTGIKK